MGDKLLEVDLEYIKENAKSTITPVLITNMDKVQDISFGEGRVASKKDVLMELRY